MGKRLKRMAIACLLLMALLVVGMVLVAFTAHAADKPAPPPKGYVSQEDYDKLQAFKR
jgi:hypothetical protein